MNARNPHPVKKVGKCLPVAMVTRDGNLIAEFGSMEAVREFIGINPHVLKDRLDSGQPWMVWFRYADMPPECQPLKGTARNGYWTKAQKKPARGRRVPTPKEDPYAPGGRLHALAAMRGQHKAKEIHNG
jgi:hypothetical protein